MGARTQVSGLDCSCIGWEDWGKKRLGDWIAVLGLVWVTWNRGMCTNLSKKKKKEECVPCERKKVDGWNGVQCIAPVSVGKGLI